MTGTGLHRIDVGGEFLAIDHPVLRHDVGSGFVAPAYTLGDAGADGAIAFQRRSDRGSSGLAVIGSAAAVRALLDADEVRTLVSHRALGHISVPRDTFPAVEDLYEWGGGGDWDWMWTTAAPPALPHEDRIEVVDGTSAGELTAFLAVASPRTHGEPFARPDQFWVVVREDGRLLACGSWDRAASGLPVLAGIAVDPSRRGEGYGAAVTAYLTRGAVSRFGACTLGMFADNVTARRLYHGLDYRTGARWRTRWVLTEASAQDGRDGASRSGRPPGHRRAVGL